VARRSWPGWCPLCERPVTFRSYGTWHRDELLCGRCRSIPRHRALIEVLTLVRPHWRSQRIWEIAPAGPASQKLRAECAAYVGSHYWPNVPVGTIVDGNRCEDLEHPTFGDGSFDIIVSSDVLEHIVDVDAAHAQIARVLADGGVHVWTAPQYRELETSRPRVRRSAAGLEHLQPAEYHGDPVCDDGALVTFDWGRDLPDRVEQASGLTTSVVRLESRGHGLLGDFLEVFVSQRGTTDHGVLAAPPAPAEEAGREALAVEKRIPRRPVDLASYRSWWITERLRDLRSVAKELLRGQRR
jgi:SAM-dependent methyltransferase